MYPHLPDNAGETYPEWPQVVVVGFKEMPPVAYRVIEALGGEVLLHRANVGVVEEEERTHSEGGRVERRADDPLLCSFCGKSEHQVKKLVAGPGVYICDECVDVANEIID